MTIDENKVFQALKETLDSYYPITEQTWTEFQKICTIKELKKNDYAFDVYNSTDEFYFLYKGLFRTFSTNEEGKEYTKTFFWEGRLFGPMLNLLFNMPVTANVQAIEDSIIIAINHTKFRELLEKSEDLKMYQILYLEKHWMLQKDRSINSIVLEDAQLRYQNFLNEFKHIVHRLSQHHIASYLGISPTHLSRIRKNLKNQHM